MSSSLNGISSYHNNGMEGGVVDSRSIGCVYNLPIIIIKELRKYHFKI